MTENLEYILTHLMKAEMQVWMNNHPESFEELIKLSVSDREPYAWRASWLLWDCMEHNDKRLSPYIPVFLSKLRNVPANRQREYLKILQQLEIGEDAEGQLIDEAVKIWSKISNPPALRMNAFRIIFNAQKKYPELKEEFSYLIQDHYLEDLTPGALHSVKKLLKEFREE